VTVLVAATPAAVQAAASVPAALVSQTARPAPVQAVASLATPTVHTSDPAADITISAGAPRRGWDTGGPARRGWSASIPTV